MLRITLKAQTDREVILAVDGKVVGGSVQVLAQEIQRYQAVSGRLVLVLDGVQFIDEAGLALLQGWSGPRLELRGGSPFVRALLSSVGLALDG